MLLRQGFPLTSLRTLRIQLEVLDFNPGTLEDVITLLKVKVQSFPPNEQCQNIKRQWISFLPSEIFSRT
uniref:Putative LOC755078 [Strongylocentrotus purpuratus] n=1 Tax=Lepeophtheirus salmonis TaxID=72036 RepID=A0A0K2T3N3_LEPSM